MTNLINKIKMKTERTYKINNEEIPISKLRGSLEFYLRNAIGTPSNFRLYNTGMIAEDENIKININGKNLLFPLINLLNNIEPSFIEIIHDKVPLSMNHKKQSTSTKWQLDYSSNSRLIVNTKQTSYFLGNFCFDTNFILQNKTKNSLGLYRTNLELKASQKVDNYRILLPLENKLNGFSSELDFLLYRASENYKEYVKGEKIKGEKIK